MPINPYEPELAKRRTTLQIADRQLRTATAHFGNITQKDAQTKLNQVLVALKDYQDAAKALSEWVQQKPGN